MGCWRQRAFGGGDGADCCPLHRSEQMRNHAPPRPAEPRMWHADIDITMPSSRSAVGVMGWSVVLGLPGASVGDYV